MGAGSMDADVGRVALEHELNALIVRAKVVERRGNDGLAAIDDRDVIGDLFHFRELMR